MSRCNTIIAAALAAAALAAPPALAQLPDHTELSESAAPAREPRSRPFRASIPDPVQDLRSLEPRDAVRATTPSAEAAAPANALSTGDAVAQLPFVLAVVGALVVGFGAGCGLQLLRVRRRHAGVLGT